MSRPAFTKTKGNRGAFLVLLFGFGVQAEELSLDQAVRIALDHNIDVLNTTLDVAKTKDRSAAFRSGLFPKLSFYALGSEQLSSVDITIKSGRLGTYPGIGPIPAQDQKFSTPMQPTGFLIGRISQPLSGLYRTRLNMKALAYSTQISQQKVRAKREDVMRDVKQLYYNIEQTQSSLAAAHETVQLYKEVERVTGEYVLKQAALQSELLQAQANLADAEQSELTLSDQEANQKEQLNDLLGRDVLTEFRVTEISQAQHPELNLAAARQQALKQRPEVQQARLKTLQSEQEAKAKRAEYIPEVSAEFNNITLLNFNSFLPGGTYSVGVSLSWEPFDWGRKKNELAEKRATVSQDKNTQTSAERKVVMEVDSKYRQVEQTWSKLHAAGIGQRAATENLRVGKNQYEVKRALLQVVLQAQTTLAQANSGYYRALADYWSAKAEFEHALGEDQ